MGRTCKTLFLSIAVLAGAFGTSRAYAQAEAGISVEMENFALPEYRKDGRLLFILYGRSATNQGSLVTLVRPMVDLIKEKLASINDIVPMNNVEPYSIDATDKEREEFWAKAKHSEGLLYTEKAVLDKGMKTMNSDEKVHLRSRELDADALGFDVYYDTKLIHFRSGVKLVIRPEAIEKSEKSFFSGKNTKTKGKKKKK